MRQRAFLKIYIYKYSPDGAVDIEMIGVIMLKIQYKLSWLQAVKSVIQATVKLSSIFGRSCGRRSSEMKVRIGFLILLAPLYCNGEESVPVMVGAIEGLDACMTTSRIQAKAEIRTGPSGKYPVSHIINQPKMAWSCSYKGEWKGVVFSLGDEDCGVSSPVDKEQAYKGPCQSGWVLDSQIQDLAG
ncbi:hypothetical protein ACJJIF_21480 [Microbulbifer sp. SSSA002]|uniref:hypothetical protein n=1 Tax=Microbulbifer sp. SSSA002 TaxID=3243376 RepID=UPI00403A1D4C